MTKLSQEKSNLIKSKTETKNYYPLDLDLDRRDLLRDRLRDRPDRFLERDRRRDRDLDRDLE